MTEPIAAESRASADRARPSGSNPKVSPVRVLFASTASDNIRGPSRESGKGL